MKIQPKLNSLCAILTFTVQNITNTHPLRNIIELIMKNNNYSIYLQRYFCSDQPPLTERGLGTDWEQRNMTIIFPGS